MLTRKHLRCGAQSWYSSRIRCDRFFVHPGECSGWDEEYGQRVQWNAGGFGLGEVWALLVVACLIGLVISGIAVIVQAI